MSEDSTKQIFSDLFRYLEVLETQNAAMLQFLKDKKVIKESQFSSYLEQAAAATDVKWRAARVRMEHLLAEVPQPKAQSSENGTKEASKTEKSTAETSEKRDGEAQAAQKKPASGDESGEKQAKPAADRPQPGKATSQSDQVETKAKPAAKMDTSSQPFHENATAPEKQSASDTQQTTEESKPHPKGVEKPEGPSGEKAEPQLASSGASKAEAPQQKQREENAEKDAA
jgi:hypothetical protein